MKEQTLTLLPLGGVGRIGMNAMLLGYGDDYVLLDCGVMFPEAGDVGVELVLPSLAVLSRYKDKLRAIVLTHGHEDHIGAVPYVLRQHPVPVYATRFTAGLLQHKLREAGLEDGVDLNIIGPERPLIVGPFHFQFLRVTHSIPDCVSLRIGTPVGNLLFTGDFKIEKGLRDGIEFDVAGFQKLGEDGCLLMMSDSTNAEVPGWSGSEAAVSMALSEVIRDCKGRVVLSLFASNVYRLHSVVDAARDNGRYTVLMGRSLDTYIRNANSFTNMPFDPEDFVEPKDMAKYDPDELCVICTGSQAEPRAALARAAAGTHPELTILPTDTVILSSRQIPGNERRIHQMMGDLARRGAHVVYTRTNRGIHASGHAYAEELAQLLRWVKPKFFLPVHGEYQFLQRHADLAASQGVEQTLIAENGAVVEVSPAGLRIRDQIDCTPWFVDGAVVGDADMLELKARTQVGWNGVIAVTLLLERDRGLVKGRARVRPFGVYQAQGQLQDELESGLQRWLADIDPATTASQVEGLAMQQVRRMTKRYTARKPVVLAFARWLDEGQTDE